MCVCAFRLCKVSVRVFLFVCACFVMFLVFENVSRCVAFGFIQLLFTLWMTFVLLINRVFREI